MRSSPLSHTDILWMYGVYKKSRTPVKLIPPRMPHIQKLSEKPLVKVFKIYFINAFLHLQLIMKYMSDSNISYQQVMLEKITGHRVYEHDQHLHILQKMRHLAYQQQIKSFACNT